MECVWCGKPLVGKQRKFCSVGCKSTYGVTAWRRRTKRKAIDYKGGSCILCGYSKCQAAMVFHHREQNKSFKIGSANARAWKNLQKELDKCDLLCVRCHVEEHYDDVHRTGII